MRRLHLIEIHEQPWCPPAVRNGATDCLAAIAAVLQQYRYTVPLLAEALRTSGSRRIIDLCSGGAGPWRSLAPALGRRLDARRQNGEREDSQPVQVLLTDLYPSWCSDGDSPAHLIFVPFPVDATRVSPSLPGFRTLFTAFHHFAPGTAQAILQSAVDERQGIAIFEQTRRHPLALLVMLVLPLLALLLTPFIRPWRADRFFWTYVIPAIPFVLCCDGIVSCLRTYEPAELLALTSHLHGPVYTWQAGRVRSPLSPVGVTYLIGVPTK
jgi:hypothetical protein